MSGSSLPMKTTVRSSVLLLISLPAFCAAALILGAAEARPPKTEPAVPGGGGTREIVSNGTTTYTIVLGREASPSEHHAANELQSFLLEMTGCHIPLIADDTASSGNRIFVGDSAALRAAGIKLDTAALGDEGFVLRTAGPHLVLAGGRLRGTLYAVYAFLERQGVRWLSPYETLGPRSAPVEHVPSQRTVVVGPLAVEERPGLVYRDMSFLNAVDRDWSARHRLNGHHHRLDATTGGKISYNLHAHTFDKLLPPSQYFSSHPEYFALVGGVRRAERAQLCLSNPEVLKIATNKVLEWIAAKPDATIFSVTQNDSQGWCECERCRAIDEAEGAHSGGVIHFVNQIADVVARTHPGKFIDTFAYTYTEAPPKHVRPRDNVIVRLCHMMHCDTHPLATCEENRTYVENLRGWAAICKNVYVWHYVVDFANYVMPFPNLDAIRQDIKFYRDSGVKGIYCQASENERTWTDFAELKADLLARLLWNPDADADAIIDGFLADYFGKAARPIRAYLDLLHAKVRAENIHANLYTEPADARYLTTEVLDRADALFDEAERLADDKSVLRRVRKARLTIDYARVALPYRYTVEGPYVEAENAAALRTRLDRFATTAAEEGIELYRYHRSDHIGALSSFVEQKRLLLGRQPIVAVKELAAAVEETMKSVKDWISRHKDADGTITFLAVQSYVNGRGLLGREVIRSLRQEGFLVKPDKPGDRFKVVETVPAAPAPKAEP